MGGGGGGSKKESKKESVRSFGRRRRRRPSPTALLSSPLPPSTVWQMNGFLAVSSSPTLARPRPRPRPAGPERCTSRQLSFICEVLLYYYDIQCGGGKRRPGSTRGGSKTYCSSSRYSISSRSSNLDDCCSYILSVFILNWQVGYKIKKNNKWGLKWSRIFDTPMALTNVAITLLANLRSIVFQYHLMYLKDQYKDPLRILLQVLSSGLAPLCPMPTSCPDHQPVTAFGSSSFVQQQQQQQHPMLYGEIDCSVPPCVCVRRGRKWEGVVMSDVSCQTDCYTPHSIIVTRFTLVILSTVITMRFYIRKLIHRNCLYCT